MNKPLVIFGIYFVCTVAAGCILRVLSDNNTPAAQVAAPTQAGAQVAPSEPLVPTPFKFGEPLTGDYHSLRYLYPENARSVLNDHNGVLYINYDLDAFTMVKHTGVALEEIPADEVPAFYAEAAEGYTDMFAEVAYGAIQEFTAGGKPAYRSEGELRGGYGNPFEGDYRHELVLLLGGDTLYVLCYIAPEALYEEYYDLYALTLGSASAA